MPIVLGAFAQILIKKADYVELFAAFGMNSEGWLLAEFLRYLWHEQLAKRIDAFEPQKRERAARAEKELHDVHIELTDAEVWSELKSFSTNYCNSPGKNITNRIDGVLDAMQRVQETSTRSGGIPLVLALIYPFGDGEAEKRAWEGHWRRLTTGCLPRWYEYKVDFQNLQEYARLVAWTSAENTHILFD
jgi:hypothetical protein